MTREEFLVYMDHFNNKRYDELAKYFAPDVRFQYHTQFSTKQQDVRVRFGASGFIQHYRHLHKTVREALDLGLCLGDEKHLLVELYTEFHALEDTMFTAGFMKKGDVFCCTNYVLYELDDNGLFKDVMIAHFRVQDPSEARL